MTLTVKVKTRAKKELVRQLDSTHLEVAITQTPIGGKANSAVIQAIANYFNISNNKVEIITGLKSKSKVVEIL